MSTELLAPAEIITTDEIRKKGFDWSRFADPANWHPAANIYPLMSEDEISALADDIELHDLKSKMVLIKEGDKVLLLDGRNRALALTEFPPEENDFVYWSPGSPEETPLSYVVSQNTHRRHLTSSQLSMVAAKVAEILEGEAKKRQTVGLKKGVKQPQSVAANLRTREERSAAKAAKIVGGVSARSVDDAIAVRKADPVLADKVAAGQIKVSAAKKSLAPLTKQHRVNTPAPSQSDSTAAKPSEDSASLKRIAPDLDNLQTMIAESKNDKKSTFEYEVGSVEADSSGFLHWLKGSPEEVRFVFASKSRFTAIALIEDGMICAISLEPLKPLRLSTGESYQPVITQKKDTVTTAPITTAKGQRLNVKPLAQEAARIIRNGEAEKGPRPNSFIAPITTRVLDTGTKILIPFEAWFKGSSPEPTFLNRCRRFTDAVRVELGTGWDVEDYFYCSDFVRITRASEADSQGHGATQTEVVSASE